MGVGEHCLAITSCLLSAVREKTADSVATAGHRYLGRGSTCGPSLNDVYYFILPYYLRITFRSLSGHKTKPFSIHAAEYLKMYAVFNEYRIDTKIGTESWKVIIYSFKQKPLTFHHLPTILNIKERA